MFYGYVYRLPMLEVELLAVFVGLRHRRQIRGIKLGTVMINQPPRIFK
jgi:hypothetical protein